MPRTKEQNETIREATRVKIHLAAVKLFSQKGLIATSVQEIAETAQISHGLLYRHYKSKEDLFGALVSEALDGLELTAQLFISDESPIDVLRKITETIIDDLTNEEEFLQYMMMLTHPFLMNYDFPWMKDIVERDKLIFTQLARLIERGQSLGQFRHGDSMQLAQFYFFALQGVYIMKQVLKKDFIAPTAEMMIAFIVKDGENYNESK